MFLISHEIPLKLKCNFILLECRIFILWIWILFSLGGCSFLPPQESHIKVPVEKVFHAKFDHVWRATQLALKSYPIKQSHIDRGLITTDFIKGPHIWSPPYVKKEPSQGLRSQLKVKLSRGQAQGHPVTRVTIFKALSIKRDFFSDNETISSDGMEESALLYRIERELKIDKALERLQKRSVTPH